MAKIGRRKTGGAEAAIRKEICEVGRRMWLRGFGAGFDGNISARLGEREIVCTPTAVLKGFLAPAMLCVIDLEGNVRRGKGRPTSEILLHLAIYKRRNDVRAVIHAHPPYATAFCCAGVALPEGVYPEADAMLGRVPIVEYVTPGNPALGRAVAGAIEEDTNTVLMGNHGSVNFGPTLTEAYCRLEVLEAYCRILLYLKQIGKVRPVGREMMRELLELKAARGLADGRLGDVDTIGARNGEFFGAMGEG